MSLTVWDYTVFGAMLTISAGIGVYYSRQQKTVRNYMLANREMTAGTVSLSLMATFLSAVSILGGASESYLYGTLFHVNNFSYIIGTPVVAYVFLPVFHRMDEISVYQYLERRFGRATRLAASGAFLLQMSLYMGIVLYAPALALSVVTKLNLNVSIVSIGCVCTFYSALGGMKAVLVTDAFQSVMMFAAIGAVIVKGFIDVGGISHVFSLASDTNRIEFFKFDPDPTIRHTTWSQIIGGMFSYFSLFAVNQAQVQRLLSTKSMNEARKSLWISSILTTALSYLVALVGLIIFAKYGTCDPLIHKRVCASDQLLPLFVIESFSELPGLSGLFIAGLLCGSLSTISSAINSLSAITWQDFIQPLLKNPQPTWRVTLQNKILAVFFGLLCIGVAFIAQKLSGVLQASMTIFGIVGGPLLGLFTLGMIFPRCSQRAALPSFFISLAFGLWIGFGGPKPKNIKLPLTPNQCGDWQWDNSTIQECKVSSSSEPSEYFYLYKISYMWYAFLFFAITVILGNILSLIFPQKTKVDSSLLSPVLNRILGEKNSENKDINILCLNQLKNMEETGNGVNVHASNELFST